MTRFYHSTNTRYNIYFNANEAYKETLKNRLLSQEDNMSEMLYIFPDNSDSATMQLPGGSFTTTIDKTTKAIKLHSIKVKPQRNPNRRNDADYQAWLQQKEYTPFMDNVWMLLAKSEFHEAKYLQAITTFMYISKIYASRPEIVAECQLWVARAYTEMGWLYEAGNILHKMELAGGAPDKHKALYSAVKANYLIRNNELRASVPHLEYAIKKEKDKHQKLRMKYLLGQIYTKTGDVINADKAFASVQGMNTPYKYSFNAKLQQIQLDTPDNKKDLIASLSKMAKSAKNKEYLDQIYYVMGNSYLQKADTVKAIESFRNALEKSTRNGYDKAMVGVRLGDLYFDRREFIPAQPLYSNALPQLKKSHIDYPRVALRSDVLDALVVHIKTVHDQDSMQHLAQLPEEERLKIINDKIEKLKKEEEEAKKEEERLQKAEERQNRIMSWADLEDMSLLDKQNTPTIPQAQTPTFGQQNNAATFYFYNEQTVAQGKIAFQKSWGNRKLEDDWRRRTKSGFSSSLADMDAAANQTDSLLLAQQATQSGTDGIQTGDTVSVVKDVYSVEYYLQQLPFTEEAIKESNDLIENALFNMGVIYKNKLEDMDLAIDAFDTDLRRFPNTPNREEIYYQLFLIYMQTGDKNMMATYRNRLLNRFPESLYARALSEPDYEWNFKHMPAMVDSLYNSAYNAYMAADVTTVRNDYETINRKYPLTDLMPKFSFLNALSYAQTRDARNLENNLRTLTEKYPKADVTPLATEILGKLRDGRILLSDGSPITDFDWSKAYASDSTLMGKDGEMLAFSDSLDTEYMLLLMFKTNTVDRNELLYQVADYNFSNYVIQTFDLSFETEPPYDILQMRGFKSFANVRSYVNKAFSEEGLMNKIDTAILAMPISVDNYTKALPRLGMEQYTTFFAEHFNEQLPVLIAHWNNDSIAFDSQMAQLAQQTLPDDNDGDDNLIAEVPDQQEDSTQQPAIESTTKIRVNQDIDKPVQQQEEPVNDKQITADDLLTKDQLKAAGKVDDAIKSVEEIISNPVDGIRNLFNKYNNREKLTKEEKAERKEQERIEKQQQKELKAIAKAKQDSINKIEKARIDSVARVEKQLEDSIKAAAKQKEEQLKLEKQEKENAAKAAIKAKEDARKQKEDERKAREQQQAERQRQREKERKEKEKAQEEKRKQKEKEQKERLRQREKERQEKEKQAEEKRKQQQRDRN
ncbi:MULTISPECIES: hypothetical protein [unclassified Dysgonomonas]|uniref:type IX secretion system periplasmic lipoprotein PorW/SprE n=1 Tax=unclassified Dysgonomonas TaxID=2630389 RepID=UPI0024753994|nr:MULTISPECIES: hypothetical protein [unclassified Dysgonomonas]